MHAAIITPLYGAFVKQEFDFQHSVTIHMK